MPSQLTLPSPCPPAAGALNEKRLQFFLERFESLRQDRDSGHGHGRGSGGGGDAAMPPFHYGSHYSNAGIVGWLACTSSMVAAVSMHVASKHKPRATCCRCLQSLARFPRLNGPYSHSRPHLQVLFYLLRQEPFTKLARALQAGQLALYALVRACVPRAAGPTRVACTAQPRAAVLPRLATHPQPLAQLQRCSS